MRPFTSIASVGLAAALTLTLAGCFSPSAAPPTGESAPATETAPATTAEPATGELITGTGYSFNAPESWTSFAGSMPTGVDVVAIAATADADGFSDNINVVLSPAGEVAADVVETAGVSELEGAGAADVTVRPRVTVAGADSAHLSAQFTASGATYQIEQYYATNAGQTYVITFSFGLSASQADREAVAGSVLASWTWGA